MEERGEEGREGERSFPLKNGLDYCNPFHSVSLVFGRNKLMFRCITRRLQRYEADLH